MKGNKKRKGKGKDKNKTAPGEGLADRKRPKIEELKVNIAKSVCCFVFCSVLFYFILLDTKNETTERLFW